METIEAEVRQFGTQTNLVVWEGIPWGGATTLSPESQVLRTSLRLLERSALLSCISIRTVPRRPSRPTVSSTCSLRLPREHDSPEAT